MQKPFETGRVHREADEIPPRDALKGALDSGHRQFAARSRAALTPRHDAFATGYVSEQMFNFSR